MCLCGSELQGEAQKEGVISSYFTGTSGGARLILWKAVRNAGLPDRREGDRDVTALIAKELKI